MVLGTEFGSIPRINDNDGRDDDEVAARVLPDLQAKESLHQTLVVMGAEFGRTPHDNDGRDHQDRPCT